jgi:hypothetical protein
MKAQDAVVSWYLKQARSSQKKLVILRPTVSRPVCLGVKHPFEAYDQTFITVRQLRVRWCGAPSLASNRILSIHTQGPHRKRCVQKFFYCCVCIRCRGNVFTKPLSSNVRGLHTQTRRLTGGSYEVRGFDGLRGARICLPVSLRLIQAFKINRKRGEMGTR